MKIYKFELPLKLPNASEYLQAINEHTAAAVRQETEEDITSFIRIMPKIKNPVTLHFIWVEKNYRQDLNNISFAKKFILDALVNNGILQSDSYRHVKGFRDDFICGDQVKVIVEIEEQQL